MRSLPHHLDRTIAIRASRETVFRFFTDNNRWASWWGPGSTIDPRPGGRVLIRYPGGVEVSGEVLELVAPERISFSYGYVLGQPFPAASTRVTIRLDAADGDTRLHLTHDFSDVASMDEHDGGWRYQLALFANLVSNEVNAAAEHIADDWFANWSEPDADTRHESLSRIASPALAFRDKFGHIDGIDDMVKHIGAAQRFMPGMRIERRGALRHCQGTALVEWVARSPDGVERGAGTNVFTFNGDGRVATVVGLWNV